MSGLRWMWGSILGAVLLVAAGADLLASDLPLWLRLDGRTYAFPNLTRPVELKGETIQSLKARLDEEGGDWLWPAPVSYGPLRTASSWEGPPPPWPPGGPHPLGTDELGRDVLARIIHGARASLGVALPTVFLFIVVGWFLGALAGFYRGWVDGVVSRLIEVCSAFPSLFLLLAVMGAIRATSTLPLILVVGLTRWTEVARLVRAEVLRVRSLDFVQASRALGATDAQILRRHVLPFTLGPVWVSASLGVATVILLESAMSFLGLGVPPPTPSWGELLLQAHRYLVYPGAWWLAVFPGAALVLTVAAFHGWGEGMRGPRVPKLKI